MIPMTPIKALHRHAESRADHLAFLQGRDLWTYARLAAETERLARAMVGRGIKPGDRVLLHMANLPEMIVAYHACFRMGAIAVPMNIRLKAGELAPLLRRLRPALYIGQPDLYARIADTDPAILAADRRFIVGGRSTDPRAQPWTSLFAAAGPAELPAADTAEPALLLATSGTTGQPKFVTHTLATLAAGVDAVGQRGLGTDQTLIESLPLVHASGLYISLAAIRYGAPIVLIERFDPDAVLDAIEEHSGSWLPMLPFMASQLLERQRARPRRVDSLCFAMTGGDVCPAELQQDFPVVFGVPLRSLWAATEAVGSLTYGLESGPVSRITPGAQVRLVDERGAPVPRGEVGELVVRGPNVTIGYWAGPGHIQDAPRDGWFHTGDLMRRGAGDDLWFVARKKDLIIRGGSNISPLEVECVLLAHPQVRAAAVIGVPDAVLGQRVAGFVQLGGAASSAVLDEIRAFAKACLADYKLPENLRIVRELPRNTIGKIDRRRLLEMASDEEEERAVSIR